jgi:DNA-binding NtrC family response regulator
VARILLLDDDVDFSALLRDELQQLGHEVAWLELAKEGLDRLSAGEKWDLVLLDNLMPRMSGLAFLRALRERGIQVPVVLMTAAHNDRTAIQAINLGAYDYVIKPSAEEPLLAELGPVLSEVLALTRPPKRVPLPKPDEKDDEDDSQIRGRSRPVRDLLVRIGQVVRMGETVLILGETGTGKDLVARAIHTNSPRENKPFVSLNCTALNENLLDDELFGHEAGAFTGADKLRKGRFEYANGGTLFLDEVGDMPLALQAKLLRVLENKEVHRIGNNEPIRVDVRVLAATHRDLKALVREGKFREDLFYRLDVLTIRLPPLRERKEDIGLLARHFLRRLFGDCTSAPGLAPATLEALQNYSWPGNIRQLQKVLCRAAGTARGGVILPADLDFGELEADCPALPVDKEAALAGLRRAIAWAWECGQPDPSDLLKQLLEQELLRYAVAHHSGSEVGLANRLGIARNTLRDRLKTYGLQILSKEGPSDRLRA